MHVLNYTAVPSDSTITMYVYNLTVQYNSIRSAPAPGHCRQIEVGTPLIAAFAEDRHIKYAKKEPGLARGNVIAARSVILE